jgi:archaemetzincin
MNRTNITLISFGYFGKDIIEETFEAVKQEFSCSVNLKEGHLDLSEFYDNNRRQYNGNLLLRQVDSMQFPDSLKTIGLFNVDLFIPILTFIFGQAYLKGQTGIASLYRFSNEYYGMKEDKHLLLYRFKKEVIHELGHTFGLIHCHNLTCVMKSSTYVEDIDQKQQHFCHSCRDLLETQIYHQDFNAGLTH